MVPHFLTEDRWKGLAIGVDWPSANNTLAYLEGRSRAAASALTPRSPGAGRGIAGGRGRAAELDRRMAGQK